MFAVNIIKDTVINGIIKPMTWQFKQLFDLLANLPGVTGQIFKGLSYQLDKMEKEIVNKVPDLPVVTMEQANKRLEEWGYNKWVKDAKNFWGIGELPASLPHEKIQEVPWESIKVANPPYTQPTTGISPIQIIQNLYPAVDSYSQNRLNVPGTGG